MVDDMDNTSTAPDPCLAAIDAVARAIARDTGMPSEDAEWVALGLVADVAWAVPDADAATLIAAALADLRGHCGTGARQ